MSYHINIMTFLVVVKLLIVISFFMIVALAILFPVIYLYLRRKFKKEKAKSVAKELVLGIFHPYCNAGGGGEKVLWVALQAIQEKYPKVKINVYTGDVEVTPGEILEKVKKNLNVNIKNINFIYLTKRKWIEGHRYPAFTLLGQALGSMYLAYEALTKLVPDVFIDTTGFSFSLPVFKYLGGCKTGSYIHYPTITKDMLRRVSSRQAIYNNREVIARSQTLTLGKLIYYHIFAWVYSLTGQCSDITLVNSTFTLEHLTILWNKPLHLVYPPCEIDHLKRLPRSLEKPKKIRIMSLAQFRPEKDHPLQLQAMYELREMVPEELFSNITLVLCGGCRNADDEKLVKDLMDFSKHLSLENNVEFKLNIPYDDLLKEFQNAYVGIHTMVDEHFGISVVEQMAAGLIMVAHRSGGPLLDIIETSESSRLGFLAQMPQEFAYIIKFILELSDEEVNEIRERAKASVERFNTKKFREEFLRATEPLFK
ncbi:GDP-Man:Man(3)GlcNAc(2)-PP-Dol alpha-1,2-mannosyltransferase isoform X2 [Anoplophora glabripennis]|uniref:GDP-Man:Man(3)GlcNAc(2)-PP-Dol alpha-1,2-mannosyltransferase isoform X2 n=1 Tax=Anoplophora glabripennis TaxID=217634 RepID=UPI000873E426|nr:GDP-Man:Man(3)GlcNAc(2)-PP-Dol alpha-1,2-mannosyltransferase isoform X2 [Anoplophora glabripennis]